MAFLPSHPLIISSSRKLQPIHSDPRKYAKPLHPLAFRLGSHLWSPLWSSRGGHRRTRRGWWRRRPDRGTNKEEQQGNNVVSKLCFQHGTVTKFTQFITYRVGSGVGVGVGSGVGPLLFPPLRLPPLLLPPLPPLLLPTLPLLPSPLEPSESWIASILP
jgi:hypothetical protein